MDSLSLTASPARLGARRFGWRRLVALFTLWRGRALTRRQLQCLDDRALADLGLNRADQYHEGGKSFWRE